MKSWGQAGLMNDRFSADDLLRMDASARIPRPIDLAHTAPFRIGDTTVQPATREIANDGRREILEPLVMQVLVALASANGRTLSRDDLIDTCWGGRVVTDDAVNRVITRLRALARNFGSFQIETITKVGYRLVSEADAAPPQRFDRRRAIMLGGAAVAGLGLLGLGAWRLSEPAHMSADADILLQKGMATLQNNDIIEAPDPGTSLQAIAFLTEATQAAPQSATAWGALAVAYSVRKRAVPPAERAGYDSRGRAAARRALALDPTEARGIAALRLLEPIYRNWAAAERGNREAYEKMPSVAILPAIMSNFLGNVGRWREAASYTKSIDRDKFVIPGVDWRLLIDLWASGDLPAADNELEVAVKRWPQHARVWRARVSYLMYSGRPAEALSILREPADIPLELGADYLGSLGATAEALAGRLPAGEAIARNLAYLRAKPAAALDTALACAALGDKRAAFEIFGGYYFGEGTWAALPPLGGDEDRFTSPLFQPVMREMWKEPAFGELVQRIGLEDYWRKSGTQPDYRRTA
jgi:DNA-binding winged helix-turn-helix (wHTH) protein